MKRSDLQSHHQNPSSIGASDELLTSACYITLVTHRQANILAEITDGVICLNRIGEIVQTSWLRLPDYFPIRQDSWVIMPNHLHAIFWILNLDNRKISTNQDGFDPWNSPEIELPQSQAQGFVVNALNTIIQHFKSVTTRRIRQCQARSQHDHNGRTQEMCSDVSSPGLIDRIWQRNFYSQIIQSEVEIRNLRQYILENPSKWYEDQENPDQS